MIHFPAVIVWIYLLRFKLLIRRNVAQPSGWLPGFIRIAVFAAESGRGYPPIDGAPTFATKGCHQGCVSLSGPRIFLLSIKQERYKKYPAWKLPFGVEISFGCLARTVGSGAR
jgi:hypothetical protein